MSAHKTILRSFNFGPAEVDSFYFLFDARHFPKDFDPEKLTKMNPLHIESYLSELSCIYLFTGQELKELSKRGIVEMENLHHTLEQLAIKEGLL